MAAERLATAGFKVDVYEQMPSPGRKLLMAGRGGLNLTHSEDLHRFQQRYGAGAANLDAAIAAFPPDALRAWADGLAQETFAGSSGRVFPKAMKASPLLRAWLLRLAELGVSIHPRHRWTGWDATGALQFQGADGTVRAIKAEAVILAMGGASWPRLGSDGAWVEPLAAAGLSIAPLEAANAGVKITWSDIFRQRFEGEPVKRLSISCAGETAVGEAIVTRDGLEGGAVYGLGRMIRAELAGHGHADLLIDVRPSFSIEELGSKLAQPRNKQSTATFLRKAAGMAPIAIALAREGTGGQLPADPVALAQAIKAIPLKVHGIGGLARAISTAGGVRFGELDGHLMIRAKPGVFVAGEMLDWEAPTGGYLLQAAFATGVQAAAGVLHWVNEPAGG
jgi:uncharacterized flavoprotein (TIGR03862 family)